MINLRAGTFLNFKINKCQLSIFICETIISSNTRVANYF